MGEILANGTIQSSLLMSIVGRSHQVRYQGEHKHGGIEVGEEERFGVGVVGEDALSNICQCACCTHVEDLEYIRSRGSWTMSRGRRCIVTGADREYGHQVLRTVGVEKGVHSVLVLTRVGMTSEIRSCGPFQSR